MNELAEYLKAIRERADLTVGEAAQQSGISAPYLYQIEDGRRTPSAKVLARLAPTYKVRMEELLSRANLLPQAAVEARPHESRADRVKRAFEYILKDPSVRAGSNAMERLPTEAKLAIIRLYERAEGLKILPEDFV